VTLFTQTDSPVGELMLVGDREALSGLHFVDGGRPAAAASGWREDPAAFAPVLEQLGEYFAGERTRFDLPLAPRGTDFQLSVWRELLDIPYGQTVSYGQLALRVGSPGAARAVGLANGSNPIALVVPCHRVIGANGTLTGYGGGMERKRWLLDLESGVLSL
jgi:methylated-DNA-[protein]-cysteine S-methyltransferase